MPEIRRFKATLWVFVCLTHLSIMARVTAGGSGGEEAGKRGWRLGHRDGGGAEEKGLRKRKEEVRQNWSIHNISIKIINTETHLSGFLGFNGSSTRFSVSSNSDSRYKLTGQTHTLIWTVFPVVWSLMPVVSLFHESSSNLKQQGSNSDVQMTGAVYHQNDTPWIIQSCAVIQETPSLGAVPEVQITTTYRKS